MKVGVSVEDSHVTRKAITSANPRQRDWIDLPLDTECLVGIELKRHTLNHEKAKVAK